jgi:hypothetical protein
MEKSVEELPNCPDCAVKPGEFHQDGCDVARCRWYGYQRLNCSCKGLSCNTRWSGIWPGILECQEYGWYAKWSEETGWVRCDKDDPAGGEDLNRLRMECSWDVSLQRMVQ